MTSPKTVIGGEDVRAIVADCGSWVTRVGTAGDDTPRAIIPTAVGFSSPSNAQSATQPPVNKGAASDAVMTDVNASTAEPAAAAAAEREVKKADADMKDEVVGKTTVASKPRGKLFAGDYIMTSPTACQDIETVYAFDEKTGTATVQNWDAMQAVWESAFTSLRMVPKESPFLIIEPSRPWKDADRAKALERAFEGCAVPAAYLGRGSAMAAFASARTTACVVDIGYQGATAVPVIDGYPLRKSTKSSTVGGRYLSHQLYEWVEKELETNVAGGDVKSSPGEFDSRAPGRRGRLRAHHEVRRERIPSADVVRKFNVTDLTGSERQLSFTDSHRSFYRLRIMDEMKMATFRISEGFNDGNKGSFDGDGSNSGGGNGSEKSKGNKKDDSVPESSKGDGGGGGGGDKDVKDKGGREKSNGGGKSGSYILPDGNVVSLEQNGGREIANSLFMNNNEGKCSLTNMVFNAVSACDVDVRRDLFSGVVLTGGCSLIPGTIERLTFELAVSIPQAYKLKIIGSQNSIERTCGAWIGGSIVSSLGTFQQAWVSKAEYDELGSMNALRKCP